MTMQNLMKSHSTELKVIEVNYDQGLKDNIFTERLLDGRIITMTQMLI